MVLDYALMLIAMTVCVCVCVCVYVYPDYGAGLCPDAHCYDGMCVYVCVCVYIYILTMVLDYALMLIAMTVCMCVYVHVCMYV